MFNDLKPHLVELRKRLGLSVLSIFIGFAIAFIFHQPILDWITKPLNNALAQVGLVIEAKGKAEWKIQQDEKNKTKVTVGKVEKNLATSLHSTLTEASQLSKTQKNPEMAKLLAEASGYAKESAERLHKIEEKLIQLADNVKDTGKKSFEGMVTTHQIGGVFFVALKVSFFAGLLAALPFILYQLWLFISPGLYSNEKKMVFPFVAGGSIMFMIGVLFAYYIVTPFGFQFLITFGSFLYTPLINIEDYVGFFTKIMLGFGLAFELPVFAYFLALLGLVTDRTLKDFFKYAVVIIFVLAALLTPPDILTQLLMAVPLIFLYGISILIVGVVNPHKEDAYEDDEIEESK